MNTFLQGCCFIPPEDDSVSTPSFLEHAPHLVPSSRPSSKGSHDARALGSKEIFYIKRFPTEAWVDPDEEKMRVDSCTSLRVLTGSSKSTSVPDTRQRKKGSAHDNPSVLSEDDVDERMSYWLCGTNPQQSMESFYYMSAYGSKTPRRLTTSTSRLLDLISMCFWKCSPGCQQIPTIA